MKKAANSGGLIQFRSSVCTSVARLTWVPIHSRADQVLTRHRIRGWVGRSSVCLPAMMNTGTVVMMMVVKSSRPCRGTRDALRRGRRDKSDANNK